MGKDETVQEWKKKIATDKRWATRALIVIYEKQTEDEKAIGTTKHHNQVGFNGVDSEILSSFAEQIKRGRSLSPKQRTILHKKMPKYASQLYSLVKNN